MKAKIVGMFIVYVIIITLLITIVANQIQEKIDVEVATWSAEYIVGDDTLQIKDYSIRTNEYLMSNDSIYPALLIDNCDTVGHRIYKNSVNGNAIPEWYNKD